MMKVLGVEGLFCVVAVVVMSILFVLSYKTVLWIAVFSVPMAFLPSIAIRWLDKNLLGLYRLVQNKLGRLQTGFLAFFACLFGVVFIFLMLLGYPMALVFSWFELEEVAHHYGRWTTNLGIVAAIILWLRCSFPKHFSRV
ncbi:MAG: hypothetical protein ABFS18_09340 [Thermodesulfobacteriota bacterium]